MHIARREILYCHDVSNEGVAGWYNTCRKSPDRQPPACYAESEQHGSMRVDACDIDRTRVPSIGKLPVWSFSHGGDDRGGRAGGEMRGGLLP